MIAMKSKFPTAPRLIEQCSTLRPSTSMSGISEKGEQGTAIIIECLLIQRKEMSVMISPGLQDAGQS